MAARKYSLTKQDLIDNGYFVEGEKVFKQSNSKRWGYGVREIKQQVVTHKCKYGLDRSYCYLLLGIKRFNEHKKIHFRLHTVIYAWYKGEVPLGYDIDHIDNNSLNNNINNLQLLTHKENMSKIPIKGVNQWYYINEYNEESWSKRQQELNDGNDNKKLRKELKPQYDLYIEILKNDIKKAKDSRDFKKWHELIAKKIKFGEFVNKYKEDMVNVKKEKE